MSEHEEYDESRVSEWLRDALSAARAGKRDEARVLLMRVIEADESSEQAWLWLSAVVDTDEDRLVCLENVLTLNPDNVRARAGMRWLQERGVGVASPAVESAAYVQSTGPVSLPDPQPGSRAAVELGPSPADDPEQFLTPDGCVYCGLSVSDKDWRCPHCAGRLATKQFTREERSPLGYVLHAYWILLAGIDLTIFVITGYAWNNVEHIPKFFRNYVPLAVGPVVTGDARVGAFIEPEAAVQTVRLTLLGLAALALLVAAGVFLRRPLAHAVGLVLVTLHLVVGLALFLLGFLGYLIAVFLGLLTAMLTLFMFNTVGDFSKEENREWLEPDRNLRNDTDYYARGRVYEKRGMWAKALLHWRRAAAMNPERDTYFASMARAYAQLGRYEQALEQIDSALQINHTPEVWQPLRDVILDAQRRAVTAPGTLKRRTASG